MYFRKGLKGSKGLKKAKMSISLPATLLLAICYSLLATHYYSMVKGENGKSE